MPARVLIVDDDARFRTLARALLEASGYVVVAEAANGEQALATALRVRPDAALVDVQLPDTDGFTLARRLADANHGLRILLTSMDPTLATRSAVTDSRAFPFVSKDDLAITDLGRWLGR